MLQEASTNKLAGKKEVCSLEHCYKPVCEADDDPKRAGKCGLVAVPRRTAFAALLAEERYGILGSFDQTLTLVQLVKT